MKNLFYIFIIAIIIYSCGSSHNSLKSNTDNTEEEAVVIKNDSLGYEIIIFDIGFTSYLNSIAKPMSYNSQEYLETKNMFYVTKWNIRANNPLRYGGLYENQIDYSPHIDYGLEVNYKLYNYFKFVEYKYKIRF